MVPRPRAGSTSFRPAPNPRSFVTVDEWGVIGAPEPQSLARSVSVPVACASSNDPFRGVRGAGIAIFDFGFAMARSVS